jgi:NAD-specific glutamate dehydrogenase
VARFGVTANGPAPTELCAILRAPVDLLWKGGISSWVLPTS